MWTVVLLKDLGREKRFPPQDHNAALQRAVSLAKLHCCKIVTNEAECVYYVHAQAWYS